ncbi:MAG: cytochrome c peroxidase [Myxococcota bacterium]
MLIAALGAGCGEREDEGRDDGLGSGARGEPFSTSEAASEAASEGADGAGPSDVDGWRADQLALMRSMSIDALGPVPRDLSNRVADDPRAAELGHRLFFDTRLSSNGQVSCASCHLPDLHFSDGRRLAQGVSQTSRNTPTVVGAAWSPWQFWDGRRDSLWSQALAPFESTAEMNVSRLEVVVHVARDPVASTLYQAVFGGPPIPGDLARLPKRASPFGDAATQDAWFRLAETDRRAIDLAFAQIGKAIAAYERRLVPGPSRFDRYVRSLSGTTGSDTRETDSGAADAGAASRTGSPVSSAADLTNDERAGLALFLDAGRTHCLRCHNGPLFTNHGFHRVGTDQPAGGGLLPDFGRFLGLQAALIDPFNCLGAFSDAPPEQCREIQFVRRDHLDAETGKFKTPTLRGLGRTAPYMHDGRFASLGEVVDHYRSPPPNAASGPDGFGGHELFPLALSDAEAATLVQFLRSLDGDIAADARWLGPPSVRTGNSRPSD